MVITYAVKYPSNYKILNDFKYTVKLFYSLANVKDTQTSLFVFGKFCKFFTAFLFIRALKTCWHSENGIINIQHGLLNFFARLFGRRSEA